MLLHLIPLIVAFLIAAACVCYPRTFGLLDPTPGQKPIFVITKNYPLLILSLVVATVAWLIATVVWILPHFGPLTIFFVILGLESLLALFVWHLILAWIYRRRSGLGWLERILWIAPSLVLAMMIVVVPLWDKLPMNVFRDRVASPVPSSVASLRIGGEHTFMFEHTVMYFELSAGDFPQILARYPYKNTEPANGTELLEEYAKEFLDLELDDLAPYDLFVADLTPEAWEEITTREKIVVTNKERTRVVFFQLYDD